MTTFETIAKHEHEYGSNSFLFVARKVAKSSDGSTEFIALTQGYLDTQGARRYKGNLTIPPRSGLTTFLADGAAAALRDPSTERETTFGNRNFLQVQRHTPNEDDEDQDVLEFTRGYHDAQGTKRYKTNFRLPLDAELVAFLEDALDDV